MSFRWIAAHRFDCSSIIRRNEDIDVESGLIKNEIRHGFATGRHSINFSRWHEDPNQRVFFGTKIRISSTGA